MQVAKEICTGWIRAFREHRTSKLPVGDGAAILRILTVLAVLIRRTLCTEETRSSQTKPLDERVNQYFRIALRYAGSAGTNVQSFA